MKTAISLPNPLYRRVEAYAKRHRVPRSRVCAAALEEFFRRQELGTMLRRINEANAEAPDDSERPLREGARKAHRKLVEGEW